MKTLKETSVGETVKVVKLNGSGPVKRRIMDMESPRVLTYSCAKLLRSAIRSK